VVEADGGAPAIARAASMQLAASLCSCGRPSRPPRPLRGPLGTAPGRGERAAAEAPLHRAHAARQSPRPGADHAAVVEGRTLFLARRAPTALQDRLLKGGENNRKIGGDVTKGRLRGAKVFTLTLEERRDLPGDLHPLA